MNFFHYTPGYLSLSRKNLSWHKNNFHSFPHISLLSTLALLKNWGIVFLPAAPRPAFSSNHTPQSVGRKLTTLRARSVRIREVVGSNPIRSTKDRLVYTGLSFLYCDISWPWHSAAIAQNFSSVSVFQTSLRLRSRHGSDGYVFQ